MIYKYYILILLLSVWCVVGEISQNESNNSSPKRNDVNEDSVLDIKTSTSLKNLEEDMIRHLEVLQQDNKIWRSMVINKILELEKSTNTKLNLLEKKITEIKEKMNRESLLKSCKKEIVNPDGSYDKFVLIDEKGLQHVTLRKDNDSIAYFEMHMAINATENAFILISPLSDDLKDSDLAFDIVVGKDSNQNTTLKLGLKNRPTVISINTPNILSASRYVNFYIKITNSTLIFGKEGDKTPLIAYNDAGISTMKYFGFAYLPEKKDTKATFLYDCPTSDQLY